MPAPKVFLRRFILHSALSRRSTRARAQRRARRQRTRAHAEARAERRRDVAQEIAAARAAAFVAERSGRVGAQPVASCFALWINALHGEAGQILHVVFPHWPQLLLRRRPVARPEFPGVGGCWRGLWRKPDMVSRKKTTIYWGTLAPAPRVVDDRRDGGDAVPGRKSAGAFHRMQYAHAMQQSRLCHRRQSWRT